MNRAAAKQLRCAAVEQVATGHPRLCVSNFRFKTICVLPAIGCASTTLFGNQLANKVDCQDFDIVS
jgi:hypothetical protein